MTDYNSMKADEYAQRLGTQEERDAELQRFADECYCELPLWVQRAGNVKIDSIIMDEAKRRVMLAIKEGSEP